MATLIGVSMTRLRKAESSTPDARFGAQVKGTSAESDSVRAFFHSMYIKIAESLPDRFVRIGRAKRRKTTHGLKSFKHDDSDSDYFQAPSDTENDDDLRQWLDRADDTPLHNATLNAGALVKRFLPPGNLSELYDHFQVVQSMLGVSAASSLGLKFDEICKLMTLRLTHWLILKW